MSFLSKRLGGSIQLLVCGRWVLLKQYRHRNQGKEEKKWKVEKWKRGGRESREVSNISPAPGITPSTLGSEARGSVPFCESMTLLQPGQVFYNPAKSLARNQEERIRSNTAYPRGTGFLVSPLFCPRTTDSQNHQQPSTSICNNTQNHSILSVKHLSSHPLLNFEHPLGYSSRPSFLEARDSLSPLTIDFQQQPSTRIDNYTQNHSILSANLPSACPLLNFEYSLGSLGYSSPSSLPLCLHSPWPK